MLPNAVLARIRDDLLDWRGTGFSILETSQWDTRMIEMFHQVEADLRALLPVPDEFAVLFLHGGASNQFAMVPMNLLRGGTATYLHTGMWSGKAIADAQRLGQVHIAASTAQYGFRRTPRPDEVCWDDRASYAHYTPLETAHGVQFGFLPQAGELPLVADASSALFAVPLEISRFGLVYASTQKNIGVVGMTLVLLRRDLIGHADPRTPVALDYAVHERTSSRFTTPPAFCWYVTGLMLDWIKQQGGAEEVFRSCRRRAETVYAALDRSGFYTTRIEPSYRAVTSVTFALADSALTDAFVADAAKTGLHGLRGHPSVGGLRASLYVGMPDQGAHALAEFLADFEARHG